MAFIIFPSVEKVKSNGFAQIFSSYKFQDSGASSSGNNIRTFFVDMGFLPSLVDKVIEEKGTFIPFNF